MIVWLASYPRSGSTLLRHILKSCFGKDSWENVDVALENSPVYQREYVANRKIREVWGHRSTGGDFPAFYEHATQSADTIFVKTQDAPIDNQDAIYVVRDGRLALESFVAFQEHYYPGASSFTSLLCGDHTSGGWSEHYQLWRHRPHGRTLVVRFEELVDAGEEVLARIASFLSHRGRIRPWINQRSRLRSAMPAFFRDGRTHWSRGPLWSDFYLRMFFSLHGETMCDLRYVRREESEACAFPESSPEAQFIRIVREQFDRCRQLQREHQARLQVIDCLEKVCVAAVQ